MRLRSRNLCRRCLCLLWLVSVAAAYVYFFNNAFSAERGLRDKRSPRQEWVELFRFFYDEGVELVLIDPIVLRNAIENYTSVLAAVSESQSSLVYFKFRESELMRKRGWKYSSVSQRDPRMLRNRRAESRTVHLVTHHVFTLGDGFVVDVAVLVRRGNFIWIGASDRKGLNLGLPVAFDSLASSWSTWAVDHALILPTDLGYYFWQLEYASFMECPYESHVWDFHETYTPRPYGTSEEAAVLDEVTKIGRRHRIPVYIVFGTLLGWYRQCDYIYHSMDLDVGLSVDDFSDAFFRSLWRSRLLEVVMRFGTLEEGLELVTWAKRETKLDIFLVYSQGEQNTSLVYSVQPKIHARLVTVMPMAKSLCSVELFGVLVYATCHPRLNVHAEYGSTGWFAPREGIINDNMYYLGNFTDQEWIYMSYTYLNRYCKRPSVLWGCDPPLNTTDS